MKFISSSRKIGFLSKLFWENTHTHKWKLCNIIIHFVIKRNRLDKRSPTTWLLCHCMKILRTSLSWDVHMSTVRRTECSHGRKCSLPSWYAQKFVARILVTILPWILSLHQNMTTDIVCSSLLEFVFRLWIHLIVVYLKMLFLGLPHI
jgi:hypothetical protein